MKLIDCQKSDVEEASSGGSFTSIRDFSCF